MLNCIFKKTLSPNECYLNCLRKCRLLCILGSLLSLLIGCFSSYLQVIATAASARPLLGSISSIFGTAQLSSVFFRFEQPLAMFSLASLQLLAVCIDLFILFPDLLALFECLVILQQQQFCHKHQLSNNSFRTSGNISLYNFLFTSSSSVDRN